jgi:sugar/nucleoside kinase (ribokinase family)
LHPISVSSSLLDVVVAGLAVADVLGRPVQLKKLPKPGGLQILDSITLSTGGNVSNVGIDLVKLGFRVGAITRLGNDALGDFILKQYRARRINTAGVIRDERVQTSSTFVGVGKDGERTFLHTRGCMANFRVSDVLKNIMLIKRAKIFAFGYLGLLPEMETELGKLFRTVKRETGANISLDTGGHPKRHPKLLESFLPYVDYFIPSYEEAIAITGKRNPEDIVRYFFKAGAPNIVGVKLGAKGCYIANYRYAEYIPPARTGRVIDTTGAGDAFVAGFLAATVKGFSAFAAARIANAVAAGCVMAVGASTAIHPFRNYVKK